MERAAYDAGDWMRFSRLRGYTEIEIAEFEAFMELATSLDARYGEDFSCSLCHEMQLLRGQQEAAEEASHPMEQARQQRTK